MRDAARTAVEATKGRKRKDLDTDEILRLALTHLVEIIGEAAKHVSTPTRDGAPEIPWRKITGARDVLIHAYFEVDLDTLWDIIQDDLPALLHELQRIIASLD